MKPYRIIFSILAGTLTTSFVAHGQCAVDVVINEGTTIEMCEDAPLTITASNGYVNYDWTGPETLNGQTITPQFSGQYVVHAEDAVGCISTDTITVTIHPSPTPTILSSEGNPICPSSAGTTLSVDNPYVSYDWGLGNTGPTFFATGVGAYPVSVVDNNGCTGHDVITITQHTFELNQTSLSGCEGGTVLLEATGGTSYLWSTGETGSSIVVAPSSTTTYDVTITNGTCSESMSTVVDPVTTQDFSLVDTLFMGVGQTEQLTGPTNGFISYSWSPDDQIDNPFGSTVTITASSSHTLYLQATHSSGCVLTDSVVIVVVDLAIPNGFSPNGDGVNDNFVVPQMSAITGSLTVWNRWGDIVFESSAYQNDWDGKCRGALCLGNGDLPEGTYFYNIEVDDVTFKGYLTLKR